MIRKKTFTNSDLAEDFSFSYNHKLGTSDIIPSWKDENGVFRQIGDLFKIVDNDNVILYCNAAIEGTQTLYLTYTSVVSSAEDRDENLLLSYEQQQNIRPISSNNSAKYTQLASEVQEYEIEKLLGPKFYQEVSSDPDSFTEILDEYEFIRQNGSLIKHKGLRYVIAYLNFAKYIGESYIVDTFSGFRQKILQDSQPISSGEIKRLQQENREIAFNAFNLIREYLNLNRKIYPNWDRTSDKKVRESNFYSVKRTAL